MAQAVIEKRSPRAERRGSAAHTSRTPAEESGHAKPASSRAGERRAGQGGRRLASAFEAVSRMPALAESRRRLLVACDRESASPGEVGEAVESDAALAIAVMRAANNGGGKPGRSGGVAEAVEALTPLGVRAATANLETYDPFESSVENAEEHERFRRHAVATRHAADRVAEIARLADRDQLAVAALLHDVGHLVVTELYGEFERLDETQVPPDERIRIERRELGIDHALVGAVLVRRWGFPAGIVGAIERHHSPEAEGHAAAIRLADLIVHYASGDAAPPEAMAEAASVLGIGRERLVPLLYEFPYAGVVRRRASDPCPLSAREIDALRGLAEGKVYKQIAQELSLSVSTIRTHLHNVYRKIGAVDRAQAVLIARDRGWV